MPLWACLESVATNEMRDLRSIDAVNFCGGREVSFVLDFVGRHVVVVVPAHAVYRRITVRVFDAQV